MIIGTANMLGSYTAIPHKPGLELQSEMHDYLLKTELC